MEEIRVGASFRLLKLPIQVWRTFDPDLPLEITPLLLQQPPTPICIRFGKCHDAEVVRELYIVQTVTLKTKYMKFPFHLSDLSSSKAMLYLNLHEVASSRAQVRTLRRRFGKSNYGITRSG